MADVVLTIILGFHLLAANLSSSAALICIWLDFLAGRGNETAWRVGQWLIGAANVALLAVAGLGLFAGMMVWSSEFQQVLSLLWPKIFFGICEYFFSLILLVAYFFLWRFAKSPSTGGLIGRSILAFAASSNLLYHFPFLMFVLARMVADPSRSTEPITSAAFRQQMFEPEVLANSTHFLFASLATSGIAMMVFALLHRCEPANQLGMTAQARNDAAIWGARIALVPTLLQIPIGIWVLTSQSPTMQNRVLGGDLFTTGMFLGALLAGLTLMHQLASISLGDVQTRLLRKSIALFVIVVVLMTGTLRYGNQTRLASTSRSGTLMAAENEHSKSLERKEKMAVQTVTLADEAAGSEAKVLVGFGFNCYQLCMTSGGERVELLFSIPNYESGKERPSSSGIPLLFPFPGRIPQGILNWEGKEYKLPTRDPKGNAIHGFVHERPWRLLEQTTSKVTGQFQASVDDPTILGLWPADFRITATYELKGAKLTCRYLIENPDKKPLPCGFGTHPYFRLPLGVQGKAEECQVKLPVSSEWELKELLPTGRRLPLSNADALQAGSRFADMKYDTVFSGLRFDGDWCVSTIYDPRAKRTLTVRFDRAFRECVVFTPPHRQAICIEPYTCVPGSFGLQSQGIDAGLRVLAPGESFVANVEIALD